MIIRYSLLWQFKILLVSILKGFSPFLTFGFSIPYHSFLFRICIRLFRYFGKAFCVVEVCILYESNGIKQCTSRI